MKLNLGTIEKKEGWICVDEKAEADICFDLNSENWPFDDDSVDKIIASHIIEHLKEPKKFVGECHRIMKPGARIIISTPHCEATGASYGTVDHRWHFHEFTVRDFVGESSVRLPYKFKHISTKVKRGRFMKWQKREIFWVMQK